ncbi:hypothetical protein G7Z17_g13250 [Cylindrodendrum hubeiense]|uniref:Uncharacterized protein n=1 Tax=Cylindrodendrum hubeiense TaxID=595255 RepID=A0A9P5L9R3_9HYPO|nr:hypothetical protein G7Z17_g13250 [Cylindrodendrum hubeiense]
MGTADDLASRLRAKFSKRRHSAAASLASSVQSVADTSSLGSRHRWDWHRGRDQGHNQSYNDKDQGHSPSHRAASQTRATPGSSSLDSTQPDLNLSQESKVPPSHSTRRKHRHEDAHNKAGVDTKKEAAPIRAQSSKSEAIPTKSAPVSSAAAPTATQAPAKTAWPPADPRRVCA